MNTFKGIRSHILLIGPKRKQSFGNLDKIFKVSAITPPAPLWEICGVCNIPTTLDERTTVSATSLPPPYGRSVASAIAPLNLTREPWYQLIFPPAFHMAKKVMAYAIPSPPPPPPPRPQDKSNSCHVQSYLYFTNICVSVKLSAILQYTSLETHGLSPIPPPSLGDPWFLPYPPP